MGEINDGTGLSVLVDIGEVMGEIGVPIYIRIVLYKKTPSAGKWQV
jgi:hypothetical protein